MIERKKEKKKRKNRTDGRTDRQIYIWRQRFKNIETHKRRGCTNVPDALTSRAHLRQLLALGRTNVGFLALGCTNVNPNIDSH